MTGHEYTALRILDYGIRIPQFEDVYPQLVEKGWAEERDGELRVTGKGRAACRGVDHP